MGYGTVEDVGVRRVWGWSGTGRGGVLCLDWDRGTGWTLGVTTLPVDTTVSGGVGSRERTVSSVRSSSVSPTQGRGVSTPLSPGG